MKITDYLEKMGFPFMQVEILQNKNQIMDFIKPSKNYKIGENIHISEIDNKYELISSHRNSPKDELVFDKIEDAIVTGLQYQILSNVESMFVDIIDMNEETKIENVVDKLNKITELDEMSVIAHNYKGNHIITISDNEFKEHNRVMSGKGDLEQAKLGNATYASEHTGLKPNSFEYEAMRHLAVLHESRLIKKHQQIMKKKDRKRTIKP